MRPAPDPSVEAWLAAQNGPDVYVAAVSEAELRRGANLLPIGRRRRELMTSIDRILDLNLAGRVLSFNRAAAVAFSEIFVARRQAGRPIGTVDCQIAATARSRNAAVATRNAADFAGCGITVINPWSE